MEKIITIDQIPNQVSQMKKDGEKIVLVGGCFDIIHAGHINFLQSAKNLGGSLVVLLESDQTVRKLKGPGRPITSQADRAKVLAHFSSVDLVVLLTPFSSDSEYSKLVNELKPDIIAVTAGDTYTDIKKQHAQSVHARVETVTDRVDNYSTNSIIEKIKSS